VLLLRVKGKSESPFKVATALIVPGLLTPVACMVRLEVKGGLAAVPVAFERTVIVQVCDGARVAPVQVFAVDSKFVELEKTVAPITALSSVAEAVLVMIRGVVPL